MSANGADSRFDPKQSFVSIRLAYELTLTFQKIGAPNLRTPRTFLRMAVGWNHSPHGTYGTSLKATFWASSASCFRFVGSVARTQSVMSFSSCGMSGQPNQAFGPAPEMPKCTAGFITSAAMNQLCRMFQA